MPTWTDQLLYTRAQRMEAQGEATTALHIYGAAAIDHLRQRMAKPDRTRDSTRALRLAARIIARHWKRERLPLISR